MRVLGPTVKSPWTRSSGEPDRISLWDVYSVADLVTFPSRNEGFGNALLEAIYFRKPILVNRYANFIRDIEPCGLDLVTVNGFINDQALEDVRQLLRTTERRQQMTGQNYSAAARHFSYTVLEKKLTELMEDLSIHLKNRTCPDGQRPSRFVRLAN
jgi:glycosyltransferase involved in cell wall biosynthesis